MKKEEHNNLKIILSMFILILAILALWNASLSRNIKHLLAEGNHLRGEIEKLQIIIKVNLDFTHNIFWEKAISGCFSELTRYHGRGYSLWEKQECVILISMTDEKYGHKGLDAPLILAWLEKESSGNPRAISYAGAKGLTQLMDYTADEIFTTLGYSASYQDLVFDPVINLAGGLSYLKALVAFWEKKGIKNQYLVLFYALHSYKWGSENTKELFDSDVRAFRPAIEYVNWILNRREFWVERLNYWVKNLQSREPKDESLTQFLD